MMKQRHWIPAPGLLPAGTSFAGITEPGAIHAFAGTTKRAFAGMTCLFTMLLAALACTPDAPDEKPKLILEPIDTASSIIVSNPSPHPSVAPVRLQSREVFTVGARNDSDLERELWDVQDALLTSDKHLIVIMGSGSEIRVFDSTGRFMHTIGKTGEGPGEFQFASSLSLGGGDTLYVIDSPGRRIISFSGKGVSVATASLPGGVQLLPTSCCLTDGSIIARLRSRSSRGGRAAVAQSENQPWHQLKSPNYELDTATALIFEGNDTPFISVGPFTVNGPGGETQISTLLPVPFARFAQVHPLGENIIHATGRRFEFGIYSTSGQLLRVVRADLPAEVPTSEQIESAKKGLLSIQYKNGSPDYEKVAAAALANVKVPATMPAHGGILPDGNGVVWVSNHRAPLSKEAWWARFDSEGHLSGTLELPPEWRVIRFSGEYAIVAKPKDADGFSRIALLSISPIAR